LLLRLLLFIFSCLIGGSIVFSFSCLIVVYLQFGLMSLENICCFCLVVVFWVFVLRGLTNDPTTIGQSSDTPARI
jgi:hypothetical protein